MQGETLAQARGYEGPAARLAGRELSNGWTVKERLELSEGVGGNLYSVGYRVEKADGTAAYMKAHDYARVISENPLDISRILADMFSAFLFERELNRRITAARMSRIVHVLDTGALSVEGSDIPVNYLIFELADGDVRNRLGDPADDDIAWKLRTVHQVATGLSQLHQAGVMHQNLKPSNLLDFGEKGSKVGELESAWHEGQTSPLASGECAVDPDYAPPECLYEFELPELEARLKARDLYMFGSIILYLFSGVSATCALLTALPMRHHPGATSAGFEQALPHLIEASDKVADQFEATLGTGQLNGLTGKYRELCNPDPRRRGHPKARGRYSDPYALERYVSYFDHLATLAADRADFQ